MHEHEGFVLYAGEYPNVDDAMEDFQTIKDLHHEKFIGHYESAVFKKEEGGKVKIINTDETPRAEGTVGGGIVGAVVGLLFPPALLATTAAGAVVGAVIGHVSRGMPRRDVKDLGEMLDEGEAGVILIAEATAQEGAERMMKRADKIMKKEIRADSREMKTALDQAAKAA